MTNKAGCILINTNTQKVGLIYREKQQDYTFPKGHQEKDESIMECAIRETEEETQCLPEILASLPTQTYTDSNAEKCAVYWFLARSLCKTHKQIAEELKHKLIWVDLNKVEEKLSYQNLKELWNDIKEKVQYYFDQLK